VKIDWLLKNAGGALSGGAE